jgi:ribulose-bisphosphate carboxylase large chain
VEGELRALYRLRVPASEALARARDLVYEQTVEIPPAALTDAFVRDAALGRLLDVTPHADGGSLVSVAYPPLATARDPAQLLNVLFGNSSMHPDLELVDVELSADLCKLLGGPRLGVSGLRRLVDVEDRALTCTAIKPMGLTVEALAGLCRRFVRGGIDVIKDDHGLASQPTAPFEERVARCQAVIEEEAARAGRRVLYAPNLIGTPDTIRRQLEFAQARGVRAALVAPLLVGLPLLQDLARAADGMAILAHPSFTGALRIAPAVLFGTLLRAYGADAVIFPHAGGRFPSFDLEACRQLRERVRSVGHGMLPALPVPAGGMSVERVHELVRFYGVDCMLLVGGSLYVARDDLDRRIQEFVDGVHGAHA